MEYFTVTIVTERNKKTKFNAWFHENLKWKNNNNNNNYKKKK